MRDLLVTSWVCVKQMFLHGRNTGIIATLLAILAAVLVAFCCHKSAWLWNTKYSQTLPGLFFCLLAGCTAFCCVLLYAGAGFIQESALELIDGWNRVILADNSWQGGVFDSAKQSVKDLRMAEDCFAESNTPRCHELSARISRFQPSSDSKADSWMNPAPRGGARSKMPCIRPGGDRRTSPAGFGNTWCSIARPICGQQKATNTAAKIAGW